MLLETRGLGVLAVNLGSTWSVNAAVFAGVLVMALASTILVAKAGEAWQSTLARLAFPALSIMLLGSFFVPIAEFSSLSSLSRIAMSVGLVSIPLFCGGIIFAASLSRYRDADWAMASNLLGAMAGGLLEYFSMMTGFRNLLILAATCYLIAWLTRNQKPGHEGSEVVANPSTVAPVTTANSESAV